MGTAPGMVPRETSSGSRTSISAKSCFACCMRRSSAESISRISFLASSQSCLNSGRAMVDFLRPAIVKAAADLGQRAGCFKVSRVPETAGLRVLFTRQQISARVAELGAQISRDFAGDSVILLGVLQGATIFMADLARALTIGATFDFIGVASYGKSTQSSGEVRITKDPDQPVEGRNGIVVEDN